MQSCTALWLSSVKRNGNFTTVTKWKLPSSLDTRSHSVTVWMSSSQDFLEFFLFPLRWSWPITSVRVVLSSSSLTWHAISSHCSENTLKNLKLTSESEYSHAHAHTCTHTHVSTESMLTCIYTLLCFSFPVFNFIVMFECFVTESKTGCVTCLNFLLLHNRVHSLSLVLHMLPVFPC